MGFRRGCMGVMAGFASACLLASPAAAVPSTALSGSHTQSWDVSPVPTCRLTGGGEKQPGGFNVQRIQFTGAVWCPSTPSDLGAAARVRVTDLTGNPLKQPVIDVSGGLSGQPGSSESVSLTPVLYGPRPGHQYLFE